MIKADGPGVENGSMEAPSNATPTRRRGSRSVADVRPDLAVEADGWDPTTIPAGSNKRLPWKCSTCGHQWSAVVYSRVNGRGCGACSSRTVVPGRNDLGTVAPRVATEADGWNPETIAPQSNKRMPWRCRQCGYAWVAVVAKRTNGQGCPACAGRVVVPGYNDLATTHPEIAADAHGWDATTITAGSDQTLAWCCDVCLHVWKASVGNRTRGTNCPACAGRVVVPGYNDLATTHPEIAADAHGWDPATVTAGSDARRQWRCSVPSCERRWTTTVAHRSAGQGCPACALLAKGGARRSLADSNPDLASQAHGWDPHRVAPFSVIKRLWKCPECEHVWSAKVGNRSIGHGCPRCALYGFSDGLPGLVYLLGRKTSGGLEQRKIGITNYPVKRLRTHRGNGWTLLGVSEEMLGVDAREVETAFLGHLDALGVARGQVNGPAELKFDGHTESWVYTDYRIDSIADVFAAIDAGSSVLPTAA